jgi:hypothetical protein
MYFQGHCVTCKHMESYRQGIQRFVLWVCSSPSQGNKTQPSFGFITFVSGEKNPLSSAKGDIQDRVMW